MPLPGFASSGNTPTADAGIAEQVRQGLIALGYGGKEAERAIANATQSETGAISDAEELLRLALAVLRG